MKVTVPVNALWGVMVMMEVPEPPAGIVAGVTEPAEIENSGAGAVTVTRMGRWRTRDPLVPVTSIV